jgi:hypothetical protein
MKYIKVNEQTCRGATLNDIFTIIGYRADITVMNQIESPIQTQIHSLIGFHIQCHLYGQMKYGKKKHEGLLTISQMKENEIFRWYEINDKLGAL